MTRKAEVKDVLQHFTTPICKHCGTKAEIIHDEDGGCGDPDCCGERVEYIVLRCPTCREEEDLRYVGEQFEEAQPITDEQVSKIEDLLEIYRKKS